ncbi:conserved protein of unknown function [Candidatus Hydrogenisulfobacillus filiaventi]|uniref:Uncharacterized protein n=1 Tax=Candidatus Hydrogenisulfobacillus filiaventi TaxID=2707344 RepID=A0A6F8ZJI2_9FIRM|nr:hypothetical protein [Bacillota bacterium]CAB1130104.1 conserved protein of unknown function [Candidatus Hydrogenisulfobacillus filiaventi]
MVKRKRRWRVRWWRLAGILILGSFAVDSGRSLAAWWRLQQQQAVLERRLAVTRAQTAALNQAIREVQSPADLKAMLTGQRPLPVTPPSWP